MIKGDWPHNTFVLKKDQPYFGANTSYIVGCHGVVQLGGLVPGYPWEVPLRLRLVSLFYSLKSICQL